MKSEHDKLFNEMHDKYYLYVTMFIGRFLKDYEAAKELAADCFVSLYSKPIKDYHREEIRAYLFHIAKNNSINYLKYISRERRNTDANAIPIIFDEWSGLAIDSMEESITRTNVVAAILELRNRLPAKCRLIFEYIYIDGLSYEEIVYLHGININTCRNQHKRAIGLIKKYVNGESFAKRGRPEKIVPAQTGTNNQNHERKGISVC